MKTTFHIHRPLSASLPVILLAFATAASASCGAVVEDPDGAGGGSGSITTYTGYPTGNGPVYNPPDPYWDPAHPSDGKYDLGGFKSSAVCKDCHESTYNDWQFSMHSRSLLGPVVTAQINQSFGLEFKDLEAPDPQRLCVQCHSPIIATFTEKQTHLPFKQEGDVPLDALREGVGCVTCHAYKGLPEAGAAGLSGFLSEFDNTGEVYFGPIANAADTPAHKSANVGVVANAPEKLCINCHNVRFDTSQDGAIKPGEDLILQDTSAENDLYLKVGAETCVDCHMPPRSKGPAADGPAAPPGVPKDRDRRNHAFVGAEFPLDDLDNDIHLALRTELLASAANLQVANVQLVGGTALSFDVSITNVKAGHNLPTGFAFLRQMWVEARVVDAINGFELGSSGVLKELTDDLCDENTLTDALKNQVQGCVVQNKNQSDPQLVNFQTKLVSDVDAAIVNGVQVAVQAPGATETWAMFLKGGAVARTRPVDLQSLAPLAPFEQRSFAYSFTLPQPQTGLHLEVALKFRSMPPYFLRILAQKEPTLAQRLTQNLGKLKPITMTTFSQDL